MINLNTEYSIIANGEVANMMNNFNTEMIISTIKKSLELKVKSYPTIMPNIIASYESYMKIQKATYTGYSAEIDEKAEELYRSSLEILANHYNFYINIQDTFSLSSPAIHLYELLVSSFQKNIVDFFVNYIIKEQNGLYDLLNLSQYKKSKDSSTIYNKKLWKNSKLSLINANLELVLDNICTFDITFENFLSYCNISNALKEYILSFTFPKDDFFKNHIAYWIKYSEFSSPLITEIRLNIQYMIPDEMRQAQINIIKGE